MRADGRKVFGLLVVCVAGIAFWRGGWLLLLGLVFGGCLYVLKWLFVWKVSGVEQSFFHDFLEFRRRVRAGRGTEPTVHRRDADASPRQGEGRGGPRGKT
jgi:hypothetical protein